MPPALMNQFYNVVVDSAVCLDFSMLFGPDVRPFNCKVSELQAGCRMDGTPTVENINFPSSLLRSLLNWGAVHTTPSGRSSGLLIKIYLPAVCAVTNEEPVFCRELVALVASHWGLQTVVSPGFEMEWETYFYGSNVGNVPCFVAVHLVLEMIRVRHNDVSENEIFVDRPIGYLMSNFPQRQPGWTHMLPCESHVRLALEIANHCHARGGEARPNDLIRQALVQAAYANERVSVDDQWWIMYFVWSTKSIWAALSGS